MDIFTTNGAGLFFCKEAKSSRNKKIQTLVTEASASVARRRFFDTDFVILEDVKILS